MTTQHIIMACAACFCVGLSIGVCVAIYIQCRATAGFNRIISKGESNAAL